MPSLGRLRAGSYASAWDQMISTGNGVRTTVREYTRDALGLTDDETDRLFYADNTVDDLHQLVKKLVNGEDILGGETENGGEST